MNWTFLLKGAERDDSGSKPNIREMLVPTVDTARYGYFMDLHIASGRLVFEMITSIHDLQAQNERSVELVGLLKKIKG